MSATWRALSAGAIALTLAACAAGHESSHTGARTLLTSSIAEAHALQVESPGTALAKQRDGSLAGRGQPEEEVSALLEVLRTCEDFDTYKATLDRLGGYGSSGALAVPLLADVLSSGGPSRRFTLKLPSGRAVEDTRPQDSPWVLRALAAQVLGRIKVDSEIAIRSLESALLDPNTLVHSEAARALAAFGLANVRIERALRRGLKSSTPSVRRECVRAVGRARPHEPWAHSSLLRLALRDEDLSVLRTALLGVRELGPTGHYALLCQVRSLLEHPEPEIVLLAVRAIDAAGAHGKDCAPALRALSKRHGSKRIRELARRVLQHLESGEADR